MLAFLLPASPWLSGRLTIPWDAKSQFFPQVQFLASSLARGEWPWWSPNVFAGWPQISDPQSLLFSPLHVLLAIANPAVSLRAVDAVTFAYLLLGGFGVILFFHDRGWHSAGALVAAMAFALGGAASARRDRRPRIPSASCSGPFPRSPSQPLAQHSRLRGAARQYDTAPQCDWRARWIIAARSPIMPQNAGGAPIR